MRRRWDAFALALCAAAFTHGTGDRAWAGGSVLQEYIRMGLASNLALNQKGLSHSQALEGLAEARGMFLPSLEHSAEHTMQERHPVDQLCPLPRSPPSSARQ